MSKERIKNILVKAYSNAIPLSELVELLYQELNERVADSMREPRMHVGYTAAQVRKAIIKELEKQMEDAQIGNSCTRLRDRIEELKKDNDK